MKSQLIKLNKQAIIEAWGYAIQNDDFIYLCGGSSKDLEDGAYVPSVPATPGLRSETSALSVDRYAGRGEEFYLAKKKLDEAAEFFEKYLIDNRNQYDKPGPDQERYHNFLELCDEAAKSWNEI